MKPILMTCGYCDRGITDPDLHTRGESCKPCNGKGEIVVLHAQARFVGARITKDEVWAYRNKAYKVTY